MAKSKHLTNKDDVERRIRTALVIQQHTIRELEQLLEVNYFTVRKVMLDLADKGLVVMRGYRGNARVYGIPKPDDSVKPNNSIPKAKGPTGKPLKVNAVLNYVGSEKAMISLRAVKDLPRIVATIMMTSIRHNAYRDDDKTMDELAAIRLEMENNLKSLEVTVTLYKTILNDNVIWSSNSIGNLEYDVDFDRKKVVDSYKHYFPDN